ncbi:arylsulfatase [Clostridium sp. chh4-2]|uniref:sulfatase-like hydrolase/transferase n=1 Tax=Clostridium sp. chh4-2 TaxID=2067550 RepID=UPI000CCF048C|nr:sulfatase-like hydrolase/transferase [Clostridium sp. chh4-2]PNV62479.1 arylsulfatase [Clostridium sp. chh4-2]
MQNIILIMADQFRGDCVGYGGNTDIMTPYLDELASEGCYFERAYSPSPTCIPARACMITGRKAADTGFFSNDFSQPWEFQQTIMNTLHQHGYQTINVGKNHFKPLRSKLGFEVNLLYEVKNDERGTPSDYHLWLDREAPDVKDTAKEYSPNAWEVIPWNADSRLHPTEWTVTAAIEQLKLRDPVRPFYLQVSFQRPHPPFDPPKHILDLYAQQELPEPVVGNWAPQFDEDTYCSDPFEGRINRRYLGMAKKAYYASITHIDRQVGRLIHYLKKQGLYQNTTIAFVSDHGEMLGDHNMFRKGPFFEGSARIPFIIKFAKGILDEEKGTRKDIPVSLLDLYPTFTDICGAECPEDVDGRSLCRLIKHPELRDYIFSENYRSNRQITTGGAAVIGRRYKYIWNSWLGSEYLFDLEADPEERENLAEDNTQKDVLKHMRELVIEEYRSRPEDDMLDADGRLKAGRVLPAYRRPKEK